MALTWFSRSEQPIIATINSNHITLNAPAITLLEGIDKVRLGYDQKKRIVVIGMLTRDETEDYRSREDELLSVHRQMSYVRINCTAFIDIILGEFEGLSLKVLPLKFPSYYDEKFRSIVIDFNKEVE